jgi:hypothetical protein
LNTNQRRGAVQHWKNDRPQDRKQSRARCQAFLGRGQHLKAGPTQRITCSDDDNQSKKGSGKYTAKDEFVEFVPISYFKGFIGEYRMRRERARLRNDCGRRPTYRSVKGTPLYGREANIRVFKQAVQSTFPRIFGFILVHFCALVWQNYLALSL